MLMRILLYLAIHLLLLPVGIQAQPQENELSAREILKSKSFIRVKSHKTTTTTTVSTNGSTNITVTTEVPINPEWTTPKWNVTELFILKGQLDKLIENTSRIQLDKQQSFEQQPVDLSEKVKNRFADEKWLKPNDKRFLLTNDSEAIVYGKEPRIGTDGYSDKVRSRFTEGSAPTIDPWIIPFVIRRTTK